MKKAVLLLAAFWAVLPLWSQKENPGPTGNPAVQQAGIRPNPGVITQAVVTDLTMNYPYCGRLSAIAVNPLSGQHIIVAGESGGLFETKNAGGPNRTWKHLSDFNHHEVQDVLIVSAPGGHEVYVATGNTLSPASSPLIWKRNARGEWSRTRFSSPGANSLPDNQIKAYRVVQNQFNSRIYACGEFGVAVHNSSTDTWALKPVPGGRAVYALDCLVNGTLVAATSVGMYYSTNHGDTWLIASAQPAFRSGRERFSLKADPSRTVAVALQIEPTATRMYSTTDNGQTWRPFQTTLPAINNGAGGYPSAYPVFNTTSRSLRIYASNQFEVNYADGAGATPVEALNAMQASTSLNWTGSMSGVPLGHSDTRQVVLLTVGVTPEKLIVTSDGGFHIADVSGNRPERFSWTTENASSGLKALQVTTVTGHDNTFYFGTWDNGFGASSNGDRTITTKANARLGDFGGEGFVVPMLGPCRTYSRLPLVHELKFSRKIFGLDDRDPEDVWSSPSADTRYGPVFLSHLTYLQQAQRPAGATFFPWKITRDSSRAWADIPGSMYDRFGFAQFSCPAGGDNWKMFVGMRDGARFTLGILAKRPTSGEFYWTYPPMRSLEGGLGAINTGSIETAVFCVNPVNSDHLLACEQATGKLKVSRTGGNTWQDVAAFNDLLSRNGQVRLKSSEGNTAIYCMAFSPFNENTVLIGTISEGLFLSRDGGVTWSRLHNPGITLPTSFHWLSATEVYISSYGRGIFKVTL